MSAITFVFSFIEYSKGAREKKRRDVAIEDEKPDGQKKSEPEPEIEIGREVISRDGFWPTWVQTPARRDPTRDFKLRIEFSAERAEFFPTFIPGNARKSVLSGNKTRVLELEDGEEGILCVLEPIENDGELRFILFDLWGSVHIMSFLAKNWQEILQHFSGSRRFAGPVKNFFWKESRVDEEQKRAEEEKRKRADEERKRLEDKGRLAGLLSDLKSLIKKGGRLLK